MAGRCTLIDKFRKENAGRWALNDKTCQQNFESCQFFVLNDLQIAFGICYYGNEKSVLEDFDARQNPQN